MRIGLFCEFLANTANGIVMQGRAEALGRLGHNVSLIFQPYKYGRRARHFRSAKTQDSVTQNTIFSRVFVCSPVARPLYFLLFILFDVPRVFLPLRRSEIAMLHKAMPVTLFYVVLLKISGYRGKIIVILDDWEGVGGFASVRNAESVMNRMIVTFAEELTPLLADGILCVSKLLQEKMLLSMKTRDKCIYLPNGGPPAEEHVQEQKSCTADELVVGYIGTFKSSILIQFLLNVVQATLSEAPDMRFVFVGGGDLFAEMQQQRETRMLTSRLTLMGQVPVDEAKAQMSSMDICLLVLNGQYPETFIDASRSSVKLFEYMAHGKIIVATDYAEPSCILQHGVSGLLVKRDPDVFAHVLVEIRRNFTSYAALGCEARRQFIEKYSHDVLMHSLLQWSKTL